MFSLQNVSLIVSAITNGLMAGLFFAYSFSVMPAFTALPDASFLAAMKAINRAIQNPVFFLAFFGALVSLPVCVWAHFGKPVSPAFWWLLSAALVYAAGVMGVTIFGNVPFNNALENFNHLNADEEAIAAMRTKFEQPWNALNMLRTVAAIVSFCLIIMGIVRKTHSALN